MPIYRTLYLLFLLLPITVFPQTFEGVLTFKVSGQGQTQTFEYSSKGDLIRMDFEQSPGMMMAVIVKAASGQVTMLMPQNKMYVEMNLNQLPPSPDAAATIDIARTGKKETILGYPCEQVMVRHGEREAELWVTKGLGMFVQSSVNPQSQSAVMKAIEREITSKGYFPLRMVTRTGKQEELRTEVTSVKKKSLSNDLFAVPAGYEKMQMPPRQ